MGYNAGFMSEPEETPPPVGRLRRLLIGPPRDLHDRSLFHRISLIPLLAWVGLGADGLSSSSYGPEEAFRTLGSHTYLAVGLAVMMATTVIVIAAGYSRIIERFPRGGGGYIVATSLLGPRLGVVSGCALLVDYVLTIAVSVTAAGEALFSFLPLQWQPMKLAFDCALIAGLVVMNIRGVRESVLTLVPIFVVFAVTHLVAIVGGVLGHLPEIGTTFTGLRTDFHSGLSTLGAAGMILLFLHAYSMGAGTYTGIEAVSNSLSILREPRAQNGKRTMTYMASSLAFTATGLLVLYLLWHITPQPGKTMNTVLLERMTTGLPLGRAFAFLTIMSEGALLVVAAQAGLVPGPRVLANMAVDSWMPHRFAALSERLTTQNGILLMGGAAMAAVLHASANLHALVVLYSINVFLTFSLSMFGMLRRTLNAPRSEPQRTRQVMLFAIGFVLCATILAVTITEKFREGAWLTVVVTGGLVLFCFRIRRHYRTVVEKLRELYAQLETLPEHATRSAGALDPNAPTAAVLVSSYGGLGIHTLMNIFRAFPGHFKNVVFMSVGVVDSAEFKGERPVDGLASRTEEMLQRYVDLARGLGMPATYRMAMGTDLIEESEKLCLAVAKEFPRVTFFAGKVVFKREKWYQPLLHNEVGYALQKRLHWAGHVLVVMPAKVR
jgi:amino acid transporter